MISVLILAIGEEPLFRPIEKLGLSGFLVLESGSWSFRAFSLTGLNRHCGSEEFEWKIKSESIYCAIRSNSVCEAGRLGCARVCFIIQIVTITQKVFTK